MSFFKKDLLAQADRIDQGVAQLRHDADHAAEVLAERGYPDANADEWAADKRRAAEAAEQYAAKLRADTAGHKGAVDEARYRQAEKVADAANLGGWLTDGSPLTRAAEETPWNSEKQKATTRDFQAREDAAFRDSGAFEHVAETIDGVEQVPYWRLAPATEPSPDAAPYSPLSDYAVMSDTELAQAHKDAPKPDGWGPPAIEGEISRRKHSAGGYHPDPAACDHTVWAHEVEESDHQPDGSYVEQADCNNCATTVRRRWSDAEEKKRPNGPWNVWKPSSEPLDPPVQHVDPSAPPPTSGGSGDALTVEQIRGAIEAAGVEATHEADFGGDAEKRGTELAARFEALAASATSQNAHPDVLGGIAAVLDLAQQVKSAACSYAEMAGDLSAAVDHLTGRLNHTDGAVQEAVDAAGHMGNSSLYQT